NGRRKVKLLVIGDGPEQQRLADSVQRLGLGAKIIFTGLRKDVREFIRGIDILVLPSLREGLPVAALEAMAAGKPVIATNVGGTPELISDGETGLLVKPADPLALSGALEKLLSDRQLAQTMGERGRKRVENYFSLAKMINETEKLYEECLSSNHLRSSKHLNLRSLI
ncbi:MAG: glycosyltransferase, partial [Candidatus Omnitrophota bacterium]